LTRPQGKKDFDPLTHPSVATIMVGLLAALVILVGGIVCIVNPDVLNVSEYLRSLAYTSIGAGLLGIGRGLLAAARENRRAVSPVVGATTYGGSGTGPGDPMVP
jgi:hypothetical protein